MSDPDQPITDADADAGSDSSSADCKALHQGLLSDDGFRQRLQEAQRMEAIGRLASGMAHDFNNLLTTIDGNAQIALLEFNPEHPLYASMKDIRTAVRRAAELTRQMLAFSRRQILEPVVLDLNKLVENFRQMLARLLGDPIRLEFQAHPGLGKIFADPSQLEQILIHLATYSKNAMPGGGSLRIWTSNEHFDPSVTRHKETIEPGPYIRLSMTDTGQGLSRDELPHVFDPFFTTENLATSLGLGLAAVHGVVSQHEGFVEVASEPGRGTTFHLYFPRVPNRIDTGQSARGPGGLPTGWETVLLVEDDADVRTMTRKVLERLGYRVLEAASAEEALRLSDPLLSTVGLLLTDVVMPEQGGRELTDALLARYPDLRTLFMSGYPEDVVSHHGVVQRGLDFLAKPFTPAVLARRIRAVLDGVAGGQG